MKISESGIRRKEDGEWKILKLETGVVNL